ncbi:MAG: DUF418 domain-containing protein [Pseudomonadota bacterium]
MSDDTSAAVGLGSAIAPDDGESVALAPAPVREANRITSLDFIRGIAVMGILGANIITFGQPAMASASPDGFLTDAGDADGWWWLAQFVLIDGKMRALFTLLFGAGLYLFMERAWERGSGIGLQAQRLGWLALFGLIHFYFIWSGDILFHYAICGLACIFIVKESVKTQFAIGLTGYVFGSLVGIAMYGALYGFAQMDVSNNPELLEVQAKMTAGFKADAGAVAAIKAGDYAGFLGHNFTEMWYFPFANVPNFFVETASLILLGMALYRMGFFSGGIEREQMLLWGWISLIAGTLLSLAIGLFTLDLGLDLYSVSWAMVGLSMPPRLAMALGLAALLVVYSPGWGGWLAERVRAAGRAAFTNYLGTSILMLFVFHGWALGLFGKLSRPELYLVVLATWVIMLAWSKPWLDRYRYGPLEWLWRCLTYRKRFAIRR